MTRSSFDGYETLLSNERELGLAEHDSIRGNLGELSSASHIHSSIRPDFQSHSFPGIAHNVWNIYTSNKNDNKFLQANIGAHFS